MVDSVAAVLYCAGTKRLSVPQARFLIHGVTAGFGKEEKLEEKQLEERLKSLKMDEENIAKVIAANTGKSTDDVINAMHDRTALNAEAAKEWGLVHEIKSELFEAGSKVISIVSQRQPAQIIPIPTGIPPQLKLP